MSDRATGFLAIGIWCGALVPIGSSWVLISASLLVAAMAWSRRIVVLFVAALILTASFASGVAWASVSSVGVDRYVGEAQLLSDPEPVPGGVRVLAEIDGEKFNLRAWGSPAGWLRPRLMGEVVVLDATLRPLEDPPSWLAAQGLAGRGTVTSVSSFDVGSPHTRVANSVRRTIESGARSMTRDEQALFAGLVYGDDRAQSPLTADNFDAAGLTHLLAVSGQNVAFVLAIAGPVLRRLGFRQRFAFVVVLLLIFATVTRFEPSVVRASVMTAVAAVGALIGTEVSSRRVLAIAIGLLVLVDPLIVHSVAFQLSVAASAGILLWSARVALALPGPRPLAESIAVTASAQLAVAPLLIWRFDGLPVASLPMNLLAGPAAGPVMMWGLTAGLFAGLVPPWLASVLHWPTRAGLWWIDSVAAFAPGLPLGRLGAPHIVLLFVAGGVGLRLRARTGRVVALAVIVAVLCAPGLAVATTTPRSVAIDDASTLWRDRSATVLELDSWSRPDEVLAALRHSNVGEIDLIVVHQSARSHATLIDWIRTRHRVAIVWAPELTLGVGEQRPPENARLAIGDITLVVETSDDGVTVTASSS